MSEVLTERGTVTWAVNRLRSDAFVALLDDLVLLEGVGLEKDQCKVVQGALAKVTNAATAIPDGSWWKRQIWKELEAFETIYIEWNNVDGKQEAHRLKRRQKLKSLRKKRNRIATRIRKHQYILQNELDLKLVGDSYEAFGELTKTLPEMFKNLSAAVVRFAKRS